MVQESAGRGREREVFSLPSSLGPEQLIINNQKKEKISTSLLPQLSSGKLIA
jgi:hypothetical protein